MHDEETMLSFSILGNSSSQTNVISQFNQIENVDFSYVKNASYNNISVSPSYGAIKIIPKLDGLITVYKPVNPALFLYTLVDKKSYVGNSDTSIPTTSKQEIMSWSLPSSSVSSTTSNPYYKGRLWTKTKNESTNANSAFIPKDNALMEYDVYEIPAKKDIPVWISTTATPSEFCLGVAFDKK